MKHPTVTALLDALDRQVVAVSKLSGSFLEAPSKCLGWSIRDVISHSVGVTLKFASFADGVTDRPTAPVVTVEGSPVSVVSQARERARSAWARADGNAVCHLRFGSFDAEAAAGINLVDVLAHTWDVAAAADIGLDHPDELWSLGLNQAREVLGGERDPNHYAAEINAPVSASPRDRFLAFLGRDPFR